MIAKKSTTLRSLLWVLCASLLLPFSPAWGSTLKWTVVIKGSGTVAWNTTSPATNSTLIKSGNITFNQGAYVDLTFQPGAGGTIQKVTKNADDITTWLDPNHHYRFGPVDGPHVIMVTFSGSNPVTPVDPTGNFPLSFPTNNAALAAITDLTGNYTGVTPTANQRAYNVDVAQDESGKLIAQGTVAGIAVNSSSRSAVTSDVLSYNVGAITTVNNKPTLKTKGLFNGTIDGKVASSSGSGQAPVEIATVGGTNCISGTGSYVAKVDGVPLAPVKNQAILVPTPPDAASHIRKAWSISLSITNKVNAKTHKAYIGATSVLTRPDGDVITYPEQVVKYSTKTGYSLTLKSGSNVTAQVSDKKSTVAIKGMKLEKTGNVYVPTAGTLSYQFLGQKGTGDLMLFID